MDWAERIGRRIRLRDLHVLLAVAESGSMSKASVRLGISHPVVSKTISDLEHSLGVQLFDRHSQGVELTSYGTALLDCSVNVFDEMRQGIRRIEFLANPEAGDLRIGCPDIDIAGVIPLIIDRFTRQYPRIRLQVIHANTSMLQFHELRGRNVELLIGRARTALRQDDLDLQPLFDEPMVVVAGRGSAWTRRKRLELAELIDQPWILPSYDSVPGPTIIQIFRANQLEPPAAAITTLSPQLTQLLLTTGRFVGMLPRSVVRLSGTQVGLVVLPVELPAHSVVIDIITIKERTLSPLAKLFIDFAREVAKPFAG
jgi:DNA-binding transcriptional LysR family regulator